jgi:transcriptional regulator with XRE-family HTH domain
LSRKSSSKKHFGERVLELRKRLGLSQEEFANPLGVKKSAISQIENGTNMMSESAILLACHVYRVNRAWLLTGKGPMFKAERLKETAGAPVDPVTEKIITMLEDMDEEKKRDVLKYIEKEKRLKELEESLKEMQERLKEGA